MAGANVGQEAADAGRNSIGNKMARAIWAMLIKREDYRDPALLVAA
jgi:hypothetical protein